MKKRISLIFAGLGIAALAGCGHLHATGASGGSSSLRAAATSSAVKSEAAAAGKDVLATCLPKGTVITKQYLAGLAASPAQAKALAVRCDVPKDHRAAFAKAVGISALNADMRGSFKTVKGREEWMNQVFPVILKTYQAK